MKKLLFISPTFFDYYKDLKKTIEEIYRCEVKWYADRPSESFLDKVLLRINRRFLKMKNDKYFQIIKQDCLKNEYDVVFVIFGQFLNKGYIRQLKKILPAAKFIYYTWDAANNYSVINDIADEFDVKYSFDPIDCEKYGFNYLPLFYCNEPVDVQEIYDVVSIYTVKPGKLKNYKVVKSVLPSGLNIYEHLYLQSKLVYFFYKLKYHKEFKGYKRKDFKYKKLSRDEVNRLVCQSKVVIDCQMKKQNGLTMRTFETLNLKKKLITTNSLIKNSDLYDKNNVFVPEEDNDIEKFLNSKFSQNDSISKYSINNFVKHIFECMEE